MATVPAEAAFCLPPRLTFGDSVRTLSFLLAESALRIILQAQCRANASGAIGMSIEGNRQQQEWHYLVGMEVRGPVSLEQLSALIAAGSLADTVMVAAKDAPQWRPAAQVLREFGGGAIMPQAASVAS